MFDNLSLLKYEFARCTLPKTKDQSVVLVQDFTLRAQGESKFVRGKWKQLLRKLLYALKCCLTCPVDLKIPLLSDVCTSSFQRV